MLTFDGIKKSISCSYSNITQFVTNTCSWLGRVVRQIFCCSPTESKVNVLIRGAFPSNADVSDSDDSDDDEALIDKRTSSRREQPSGSETRKDQTTYVLASVVLAQPLQPPKSVDEQLRDLPDGITFVPCTKNFAANAVWNEFSEANRKLFLCHTDNDQFFISYIDRVAGQWNSWDQHSVILQPSEKGWSTRLNEKVYPDLASLIKDLFGSFSPVKKPRFY